jgi:hypothetical protein
MMRRVVLTVASMLVRTLLVGSAVPGPKRAERGDAEAVLRAFGSGGWAVINHRREEAARGAPAPADTQIAIRPLDFFDGRHYCALDWHTIVIADIEEGNRPHAEAIIADLRVQLTLDTNTAPLQISQTPVSRFLNPERFGLTEAYYSQWGRVMEPSELAVGEHTLSIRMTNASGSQTFWRNTINFFIDAQGEGACL